MVGSSILFSCFLFLIDPDKNQLSYLLLNWSYPSTKLSEREVTSGMPIHTSLGKSAQLMRDLTRTIMDALTIQAIKK